jgi:hypothetical protein
MVNCKLDLQAIVLPALDFPREHPHGALVGGVNCGVNLNVEWTGHLLFSLSYRWMVAHRLWARWPLSFLVVLIAR